MQMNLDRIDKSWALTPFWEGNTVYNESVVFVPDKNGNMCAPLFYKVDKVISVRDYTLRIEYEEGRDYTIENNMICRTENSRMAHFTYNEFYCPDEIGENIMNYDFGGHLRVDGGLFFYPKNIHVTYTHSDSYPFAKPKFKGELLPRTMEKLRTCQVMTAVFYGDSIISGDEVSGFLNIEPHQPIWESLFCKQLQSKYGVVIHEIDTALGGTDGKWGIANAKTHIANFKPDFVILGFGNNDRCSVDEYLDNIRTIVKTVREDSPETEFILVDPMTPNRFIARTTDNYRWNVYQKDYALAHLALEREISGLAVLEIMQLHLDMQERKRFWDINNNNINHPNDFFYRIMAQACTAMVVPTEKL